MDITPGQCEYFKEKFAKIRDKHRDAFLEDVQPLVDEVRTAGFFCQPFFESTLLLLDGDEAKLMGEPVATVKPN